MNGVRALALAATLFLLNYPARAQLALAIPGYEIQLPRDGGSHPAFGIEWWYVTGWLQDANGSQQGFQITFFRSRNTAADSNPSQFAPKQLLFAHVALSQPTHGKLQRDERRARMGFGLAEAREGATDVWIDDWFLRADGTGFVTQVATKEFSLSLNLKSTQAAQLEGDYGYSRKGPKPLAASYYYSVPQLEVSGSLIIQGQTHSVTGHAWFDHEWSSEYLDSNVVGWDWLGINFQNGESVMAFRMRDRQHAQYWAGGTWRANDHTTVFAPAAISWTPLRQWRSPRTGVEYPIAWRVKLGSRDITLYPLMEDQENDARSSVGILYWEGAVEARDLAGKVIGHGYLELTGYGERLVL